MNEIKNKKFAEERALYNLKETRVISCNFEGALDGESALKETRNIIVDSCFFALRYPLWHSQKFEIINSHFNEFSRAPLWYSINGKINKCDINVIKALRECSDILIQDSNIKSSEFGWKCNEISISNSNVEGEYAFLDSKNIKLNNVSFKGKYSFQYIDNLIIEDSIIDTKDAFWHSNNVVVKNSIIKGEYLAWYSKNVELINCKIIGTQPFCYCENLRIIDCEMIDTDLAFEYSSVYATIKGSIKSIKNPRSGYIEVDSVDEIINENSINELSCDIKVRNKLLY